MKKIIYTLFLSMAITFVNAQSIPNGSFESWSTGNPPLPISWTLSGFISNIGTITVNGETLYPTDGKICLGLGNAIINGQPVVGQVRQKFPMTSRPKSLRFDCLYFANSSTPGQGVGIQVIMTKKNGAVTDTIASGFSILNNGASITNWAAVAVDLATFYKAGTNNPDSCFVRFVLLPNSSSQITVNSLMFVVDGVKLSTNSASVEQSIANLAKPTQLSISPNPANDNTSIKFKMVSNSKVSVDIIDLNGRIVKHIEPTETFSGINQLPLDISAIEKGIYIVKLTSENGVNSTKLVVSK